MSSREKDDFWDIDKLLPKKRGTLSTFMTKDPVTEVTIPVTDIGDEGSTDGLYQSEELRIPARGVGEIAESPDVRTYSPEWATLIKQVKVKRIVDKYDFFGNFRKTAEIFYDYNTPKCDFVPFYSYRPQYSHMSAEQRNYYFYWRSELRRTRYLKSDYSYIYLYVFEVLNLPDRIPPEEGIRLICNVWREYRKDFPRLDTYFVPWVNDYCLVYGLPCPSDLIGDFISEAIKFYYFKEFFICRPDSFEGASARLLSYLSDYDWNKGKYAHGESEPDESKKKEVADRFRALMEGAMQELLLRAWDSTISKCKEGKTRVIKRVAFPDSLCTHAVKCDLEIEYYMLSENLELRKAITAAVKYTENKIRALLGIKSRLAVKDLPDSYKSYLDRYFEALFKRERLIRERQNTPAYEKLYDAPTEELSFSGADEIERASWTTTMRLVDTADIELIRSEQTVTSESINDTIEESGDEAENTEASREETEQVDLMGLCESDIAYLASKVLDNVEYTPDKTTPEDTLAERINEAFVDGFVGDCVLEFDGVEYSVIDDYKEDIKEWLLKIMK